MQSGSNMASNKSTNIDIAKKLKKVHVLILGGSTQINTLFKNMLAEFGFTNVFLGNNSFQGVQILREIKINLIITDWELTISPNISESGSDVISHTDILPLSGVDFIKRLRRSPSSPNPYIPVIMFADTVEKMQAISARDAGVNEICLKPLSVEKLCKRIIAVIERPRIFITAETYKGPCRRHKKTQLPSNQKEQRTKDICIIKYSESVKGAH